MICTTTVPDCFYSMEQGGGQAPAIARRTSLHCPQSDCRIRGVAGIVDAEGRPVYRACLLLATPVALSRLVCRPAP